MVNPGSAFPDHVSLSKGLALWGFNMQKCTHRSINITRQDTLRYLERLQTRAEFHQWQL